jgi:MFS family permease
VGYYLSYLFRTINALIAPDLSAELNVSAGDLGLLTSVYFLVIAASQLPFGALLDRYGPATIQGALLLFASAGALLFATASSLFGLVTGRALLALGVALALMAGFKAVVLWFPPERIALANGCLVTLGALGAVTAGRPAEYVVHAIGWRGLFTVLAILSAMAALLIVVAVPEPAITRPEQRHAKPVSLGVVYRDKCFWRIAPLSATGIGTSWSLQSLWAAAWLRDVDHLDRSEVVRHLTVMALAVCLGALLLGTLAGRLRRKGIKTEWVLASTVAASMVAQGLLMLGSPVPSLLLWAIIAVAGAATVLSFAIIAEHFAKEISGRANAALNLLHLGWAFVVQSATGFVIDRWPESNGMHPREAHELVMATTLGLQLLALTWFIASPPRSFRPVFGSALMHYLVWTRSRSAIPILPYKSRLAWAHDREHVQEQVVGWRLAATASAVLCAGLAAAVPVTISRPAVAIHIVERDRGAEASANALSARVGAQAVTGWPPYAQGATPPAFSGAVRILRLSPTSMVTSRRPN